jgi:prevent-host-death family protein
MSTIQTVTSREFAHNISAARRMAASGDTVIITDRGTPTLALLPISEYRRLTKTDKNLHELLCMPEADGYDFDPEPVRIEAHDIDV